MVESNRARTEPVPPNSQAIEGSPGAHTKRSHPKPAQTPKTREFDHPAGCWVRCKGGSKPSLMRNRALLNQNQENALYLVRRGGSMSLVSPPPAPCPTYCSALLCPRPPTHHWV